MGRAAAGSEGLCSPWSLLEGARAKALPSAQAWLCPGLLPKLQGNRCIFHLGEVVGLLCSGMFQCKERMKHMEGHRLGLRRLSRALEQGMPLRNGADGCAQCRSCGL